jgi:cytochrome c-type biogenesis protein CcmH/NrfG
VALEEDSAKYDTLAEAYFVSGEQGKAVEAIHKAIALEPDNKYYGEQFGRFEQGR